MQVFSICNSISEGNLNWTKNKLVWQTSGSEEWQFFFNIIRTYVYNNLVLGDQRLFFCLIGNFNLDEIFDWYKMFFIWLKESSLAKMFNDVLCLILSLMVAFRFFFLVCLQNDDFLNYIKIQCTYTKENVIFGMFNSLLLQTKIVLIS